MDKETLKDLLDHKYHQFNAPEFIETDPIQIPHMFSKKEDIEISGFIAATLAWGQRISIIRNSKKIMEQMDYAPYDFILNHSPKELDRFRDIKHRTFQFEDTCFFMASLQSIYRDHNGMEALFKDGLQETNDIKGAIGKFREAFLRGQQHRSQKHVANPYKGSAAKRINMFLRWMVREDGFGVDFGLWDLPSSSLCIPLDVHVGNVSRKLGLLDRKANDWKAVSELTNNLKKLDAEDPVKYDYALFGLGVFEKF
ncbi:TIGR02757 family protein [Halosquirtibacter xylanolyticus]|uniref:TIGR02757 family protein n=1 Tax=Halosquirtibacter xylanolyticus TaxID=3374599 RepID=UPI003749E19F|nr:TIGR02757 family protein [Prolixibacteraceae bacterium]